MLKKIEYKDYNDFVKEVGYGKIDDVDVTHDGYPLSVKEAKFIDNYLVTGNLNKSLAESGLKNLKNVAGKDYIMDEIRYRLELLRKQTIADADEIMEYFTKVMRGQEKDQFGLDAPLAERTKAAQELAKRVIDFAQEVDTVVPEIKVTLNFEGM